MGPTDKNARGIPLLIPRLPSGTSSGKENDRSLRNDRSNNAVTTKPDELIQKHRAHKEVSTMVRTPHSSNNIEDENSSSIKKANYNRNINIYNKNDHPSDADVENRTMKRPVLGVLTPQSSRVQVHVRPNNEQGRPRDYDERNSLGVPTEHRPMTNTKHPHAILRDGESVESLFCLSEDCTKEHRHLCYDIAAGKLADDTSAWRRALELSVGSNGISTQYQSPQHGDNLIRLHRRATRRFPLNQNASQTNQADILAMWLLYAQIQGKHSSVDYARLTFRHIETQQPNLDASFYISLSEFEREHNLEMAKDALRRGMKENAEPLHKLEDALSNLNAMDPEGREHNNQSSTFQSFVPPLRPRHDGHSRSSPEVALGSTHSPKRRRLDGGTLMTRSKRAEPSSFERQNLTAPADESSSNRTLPIDESSATMESFDASGQVGNNRLMHEDLGGNSQKVLGIKSKRTSPFILSRKISSVTNPATSSKRKSAELGKHTKRPLLSRTRLGKAKRVNPETSILTNDESDSEQDSSAETDDLTGRAANLLTEDTSQSKSVPSIKKIDLSYMWEWDPQSRGNREDNNKNTESRGNKEDTNTEKPKSPAMVKIIETSSSQGTTKATQDTTPSNTSSSSSSIDSGGTASTHSSQSVVSEHSRSSKDDHKQISAYADQENYSLSEKLARQQKSHVDFLPLAREDNILSVNGVPYAKLGVIGKGGSCKVYRALSRQCSVVAIKKVKLAGMDRKAIEGYANEISLLKRLRGNPAIIQMYDSEVDLKRKSIFVVMELGEVDLNHVLQQRAVASGSKPSNDHVSLNMNFIRLTWQQMLSAVHCIHEERIIHSDLKPANFLFVRGALKLIDFGIAKAIQSDDTTNIYRESHIGTLNYMSPEAILDTGSGTNGPRMKIGRASDVWSLGCILFEMVYGKTPFAELHFIQKLQAIVNVNYEIKFPETVDEAAVDAMKQCLRRTPEDRPPIIGKHGLLNEHYFLHSGRKSPSS